jgi:hypothetical protein
MSATAKKSRKPYLPAMGHDRLLPFYDPLQRLLGMESVHRQLVDEARIQPHQRVLEIGCGTGNLAILIKLRQGGYSNPAAPCTCLTSEARRCGPTVLSLASTTEASACETTSETAFRRSCARRVSWIQRRSPIDSRSPGGSPTIARARRARGPGLATLTPNLRMRLHQRSVELFLDRSQSPRAGCHAAPAATLTSTSARKEGHDEQA